MMKLPAAIVAFCLLSGAAFAGAADAVADPTRLEEQKARDDSRKPAEVLEFAGIGKGDKVADLAAGSGYYTAILSRLAGDDGKVYAVNPERIFEVFPDAKNAFPAYLEQDPRANVDYTIQDFDGLAFPEPLDAAVMVLYYHDLVWLKNDRAAVNKAIYDALKPGGVFLVIDHNAKKGAGEAVTKDLHRMIPGLAKPEILAAGFELAAESDLLANPEDPLDDSVFAAERRGKTDRFIYLFRKP